MTRMWPCVHFRCRDIGRKIGKDAGHLLDDRYSIVLRLRWGTETALTAERRNRLHGAGSGQGRAARGAGLVSRAQARGTTSSKRVPAPQLAGDFDFAAVLA